MRMIRSIALVAALSLSLAACANDDDGGGVASLGGTGATGETGADTPEDAEEAIQAFAECMRENGVEDFPDPQIDEDGGIMIGGPAGGEGDFDRETVEAAMEACQDLLPEDVGPGGEGPSAQEQAAFEDALLEYAQCMRDNGIDMPDPEISSDGGFVQGLGEGIDPNDPDFQAADEECSPILDEVFSQAGRGGGSVDVAD